ncbi:MAG TPA: hypothetical protein VGP46_12220, partial [Acidimicrobiales bacterium]|nr:hypothetical protein [Acidimicrobiales bacterium]
MRLPALVAAAVGASLAGLAGFAIPTVSAAPTPPAGVARSTATFHDDEIYGVSCIAGKGCLAVGKWFDSAKKTTRALAEYRTGATWVLNSAPTPTSSTVTAVQGVSCVSATKSVCMAVGVTGTLTGTNNYAALWNWSSWKLLTIPNAPSSLLNQINAVSCTSSSYCVATGHYVSTISHRGQTDSLVWNGSSWSVKPVPQLAVKGISD